jgi:hypothetical protein
MTSKKHNLILKKYFKMIFFNIKMTITSSSSASLILKEKLEPPLIIQVVSYLGVI